MTRRLVVIGGDAAGMSGAAEARRNDASLQITVLERGEQVSYAACGIPYLIEGIVPEEDDLVAHDPAYFLRERGIEVRTGVEAVTIDPEGRQVETAGGERVGYDALLVATGARPARPPIPGADLPGVRCVRDLPDARALDEALRRAGPAPRALLVGSGAIGVEMADALAHRGARVEVIEALHRPLPALAPEIAAPVQEALTELGVTMRGGAVLERIEAAGAGLVCTVDGERSEYELVLLGTGVQPNAEIALGAGAQAGPRGAILVDRRGRTSLEGVWAAGDCATAWHRLLGQDVWTPLATTANRQGRVAGRDVAGQPARFAGVLGSWLSSAGGVGFGVTGIDLDQAAGAGFSPRTVTREAVDRSGYIPHGRPVTIRLVWDEQTGRMLGAQAAGAGEVASRLHLLALAIGGGLTVREVAEADYGYVPPLSPLRDPVERAAAAAIGDAP